MEDRLDFFNNRRVNSLLDDRRFRHHRGTSAWRGLVSMLLDDVYLRCINLPVNHRLNFDDFVDASGLLYYGRSNMSLNNGRTSSALHGSTLITNFLKAESLL
jgi:hypothetical protein